MHQLNLKRKTSTYAVSSNGSSNGSRLIGRPSFHLLGWASLVCLLVWLFLLKKLNGVFLIWEQYLGGTGSGSNGSKEGDASDSAILVEVWTWRALVVWCSLAPHNFWSRMSWTMISIPAQTALNALFIDGKNEFPQNWPKMTVLRGSTLWTHFAPKCIEYEKSRFYSTSLL